MTSAELIYLDHNSTTPMRPEVREAILRVEAECFGNPSSAHGVGRAARRVLEEAREQIASLLAAQPSEVIFTSGATEANNLAIFGLMREPGRILASRIEHPCVLEPLQHLERNGSSVTWLPVDATGQVLVREAIDQLDDSVKLLCLMFANHETGTLQPVRHLSKVRPKSVLMHCDAAQAVGKVPIDFADLGVSTLTISAHKFGGPRGVGALLLRSGVKLQPQLYGGHQQRGFRPGTEPVALIAGMAAALQYRLHQLTTSTHKLIQLRQLLFEQLQALCPPVVLNGPDLARGASLPTTLNVSFPGCRADLLLVSLDLAGVACSTGSACSSGSLLPSPVLQAMQVPEDVLRSAIRLSISDEMSEIHIFEAANRIARAVKTTRQPRHVC